MHTGPWLPLPVPHPRGQHLLASVAFAALSVAWFSVAPKQLVEARDASSCPSAEAVAQDVRVRDGQARTTQVALDEARSELFRERSANDAAITFFQAADATHRQELARAKAQVDVQRSGRVVAEARLAEAIHVRSEVVAAREEGWQ